MRLEACLVRERNRGESLPWHYCVGEKINPGEVYQYQMGYLKWAAKVQAENDYGLRMKE